MINKILCDLGLIELRLLATSPGTRGGRSVLEIASGNYKFINKNTIATFSLPSFHQHFSEEFGITDNKLIFEFHTQLNVFTNALTAIPEQV